MASFPPLPPHSHLPHHAASFLTITTICHCRCSSSTTAIFPPSLLPSSPPHRSSPPSAILFISPPYRVPPPITSFPSLPTLSLLSIPPWPNTASSPNAITTTSHRIAPSLSRNAYQGCHDLPPHSEFAHHLPHPPSLSLVHGRPTITTNLATITIAQICHYLQSSC